MSARLTYMYGSKLRPSGGKVWSVCMHKLSCCFHWAELATICSNVCLLYIYRHPISLNKCPGTYFLHGLQAPVVTTRPGVYSRPGTYFLLLISKVRGPMTFANCGTPTWFFECFLQDTWDNGSSGLLRSENTYFEAVGLFSTVWRSKRQSFNECQTAFSWLYKRVETQTTNQRQSDHSL